MRNYLKLLSILVFAAVISGGIIISYCRYQLQEREIFQLILELPPHKLASLPPISAATANMSGEDGYTLLSHYIAAQNHPDGIRWLLRRGADVNLLNADGSSPLIAAILSRASFPVVEELLKAGADTNYLWNGNFSPLSVSLEHDTPDYLPLLVAYGADINQRNIHGDTLLTLALLAQKDISYIQKLLDNGASVSNIDLDGRSVADAAVYSVYDAEILTILAQAGLDFTRIDENGDSYLMKAVRSGRGPRVLEKLIALGIDVNHRNSESDSAINIAAEKLDLPALKVLAGCGADIKASYRNGKTPLMTAINTGATAEIIDYLSAAALQIP